MDEMTEDMQLPDDVFWKLITKANRSLEALTKALEGLSREELIGFAWKFEYLAGQLDDEKYHAGQYSEDELEDLTSWIVGRGRKYYETVLHNPEKMPEEVDYDKRALDIHFEALKVYHDRFGEHMPAFDGGS